jgi:hypothetical protein
MEKVFVSSIIKGFEKERRTARDAIQSLGMQAIMAEDFGAKPYSPQIACLEGVSQSDIYLGILGPHYGSVTKGGISVTEEEFNHARKRGMAILWFVIESGREPEQERFYDRISGYEEGYHLAFFSDTTDLATQITKALHNYHARGENRTVGDRAASKVVCELVESLKPPDKSDASVGAVIFPDKQGEDYISIIELDKKEMRERLIQLASFGPSALLSYELGTKSLPRREHISFVQTSQHDRQIALLDFYPNGVFSWRSAVPLRSDSPFSSIYNYVIEENNVREKLAKFLCYANVYYSNVLNTTLVSNFYVAAVMYNVVQKMLGHIGPSVPNSFCIPFKSTTDPLIVPQKPLKVARSKLKDPAALANDLTDLIVRAFKSEDLYYSQTS